MTFEEASWQERQPASAEELTSLIAFGQDTIRSILDIPQDCISVDWNI